MEITNEMLDNFKYKSAAMYGDMVLNPKTTSSDHDAPIFSDYDLEDFFDLLKREIENGNICIKSLDDHYELAYCKIVNGMYFAYSTFYIYDWPTIEDKLA